jgi:hypothetical protein
VTKHTSLGYWGQNTNEALKVFIAKHYSLFVWDIGDKRYTRFKTLVSDKRSSLFVWDVSDKQIIASDKHSILVVCYISDKRYLRLEIVASDKHSSFLLVRKNIN